MAKPFTESVDYVYQWLDDTNRISENLGDPVNVYVSDGDYATHNAAYPSYLINTSTYTHDALEQSAVVRSLNDLNDRKVKRSGDIITGNLRINQNLIVDQDLVVHDTEHFAQMSTVLMIDISHSMILYGEDRITPAKKVAMALAELIKTRYPKDQLDILVFGNDAWSISLKELPYLEVGPYHTNTVAGLNLALDLLRKKKQTNKQIFMITDGKPSCLTLSDGTYYKNPNGLDPHIVGRCCDMARLARKLHIPITTFMIAQDPYLIQFIQEFTQANQGKAFYTGLDDLGSMIFEDYENNRSKRMR
jgi:uncharacterized protein with von Willebrand factor type A (vWA) domain